MIINNTIQGLADGNRIEGTFPEIINSEIVFKGKNNILYCEPGVVISDSTILLKGDSP